MHLPPPDPGAGKKKIGGMSTDGMARVIAQTANSISRRGGDTRSRPVSRRSNGKAASSNMSAFLNLAAGIFKANSFTHRGNLSIAMSDTKQQPGDGDEWQFAVRRGRDGKDATMTRSADVVEQIAAALDDLGDDGEIEFSAHLTPDGGHIFIDVESRPVRTFKPVSKAAK